MYFSVGDIFDSHIQYNVHDFLQSPQEIFRHQRVEILSGPTPNTVITAGHVGKYIRRMVVPIVCNTNSQFHMFISIE